MSDDLKVLNLYGGIGGNRKLWDEVRNVDVTAVEIEGEIAEVYQDNFPQDEVVITDAHEFLKENYEGYDFIWSSPPCRTHSQMHYLGAVDDSPQNQNRKPEYPDMRLYQEVVFLNHFFKGKWVVENVNPYYEPLIRVQRVGRHFIWSNFFVPDKEIPRGFQFSGGSHANREKLENWLGMELKENIYIRESRDPAQVLRNCVHPELGKHILESAYKNKIEKLESFCSDEEGSEDAE